MDDFNCQNPGIFVKLLRLILSVSKFFLYLQKMLKLQIENPTKGDWASTCVNDIKELN